MRTVLAIPLLVVACASSSSPPLAPTSNPEARANARPGICDPAKPLDCQQIGEAARKRGYDGVVGADLRDALGLVCTRGERPACLELAMLLTQGPRDVRDMKEGVGIFRKFCRENVVTACISLLGVLNQTERPDAEDARLAVRGCVYLCEKGDVQACNNLGVSYLHGVGVTLDYAAAADLFKRACDGGEAPACSNLAMAFRKGEGVEQSDARAAELHARACDAGYLHSCNNLGDAYENGRSVPRDLERARALYERACTPKYAYGCVSLGQLYSKGMGAPPDWAVARSHFARACEWREARGCVELAELLISGRGGGVDADRARQLLRTACADGYRPACAR